MDSFSTYHTFSESFFEDVIESQYFEPICYAIFTIAFVVYLYTGYLTCKKQIKKITNGNSYRQKGNIRPNPIKENVNETENWLITSKDHYSPVNIVKGNNQKCAVEKIIWENHDKMPVSLWLKNSGKTAVLYANYSSHKPIVRGAGLPDAYNFVQLHFRWGSSCHNTGGSDHMLDNKKFPLEMQVLYRFGIEGTELPSHNMLIIAYLYQSGRYNKELEPIIKNLKHIRKPNSKAQISIVPLNAIIPIHQGDFFCYIGSMVEPPYYEGVKWFVYSHPLYICKNQLQEFYQLLASDLMPIEQVGRDARNVE